MADVTRFAGDFRPDPRGISGLFRGAGMQAALAQLASGLAGRANAIARPRPREEGASAPRYASGVDVLTHTAVGWVGTGNAASRRDQAERHTLDSLNH